MRAHCVRRTLLVHSIKLMALPFELKYLAVKSLILVGKGFLMNYFELLHQGSVGSVTLESPLCPESLCRSGT